MKHRRLVSVLATLAVSSSLAVAAPTHATANPYTPPSAYSTAVGTGTATLSASLTLSGTLGGLLDSLISPIVNGVLNPLLQSVQVAANSVLSSALGASSSYSASTPTAATGPGPGAFPSDLPGGLPSPCTAGGALPCYNAANSLTSITSALVAPVASVGINALDGYTQLVSATSDPTNPILARAQVGNPQVSVLPAIPSLVNPLVSVGVVDARATCPNDGSAPSADVSATSVSLLGGLVTLSVLDGAIATLNVGGTAYASLAQLPVLNIAGVRIAPYGTSIRITVSLSPADLLSALGLSSSIVNLLLSFVPTSSIALNVIVGPNSALTTTTASAWGLGIGVDLSGSLGFTLLGLVGAQVTLPSGIGGGNYGNLLDLRLAYATCSAGSTQPGVSRAVPPAMV